jgi:hypothetical protein
VSLNGVALVSGTDYTATPSTNTISSLAALTASDVVEIVVYDVFSVFGGNVNGDFTISNGTLTAGTVDINGGAVDGTTIGAASAAAVTGTTITGDSLDINGAANINSGTTDNALTVVSTDSGVNITLTDNTTSMAVGNSAGTFQLYGDTSSYPKLISASNSTVVINEDSNDTDFRVESNANANCLFVDAGNDKIGIRTGTPQFGLSLSQGTSDSSRLGWQDSSNNKRASIICSSASDSLSFHTGTSDTERMRIDASGNVLVGKTANNNTTAGGSIRAGESSFVADGSRTVLFNRLSSDGDIVEFRKDGSAVGSIGTINGDIFLGTSNTSVRFQDGSNAIIPVTSAGADRDGAIDLGTSAQRFKDGYFSGILYNTSLRGQNDTDTGIDVGDTTGSLSNTLTFLTGGSERLRVDSSGQVMIGTTSPAGQFTVTDSDATAVIDRIGTNVAGLYTGSGDDLTVGTADFKQAIRIKNATGRVGVGNTAPDSNLDVSADEANFAARFNNFGDNENRLGILVQIGKNDGSGTNVFFAAYTAGGAETGQLRSVSGTFQLTDTSDERLKENIVDTTVSGLTSVNAMKVRDFAYKTNPTETIKAGFIAQELQTAFPSAVSYSESDSDKILSVSRERLVPVLVKAIQELSAKNDALETRLAALENAE